MTSVALASTATGVMLSPTATTAITELVDIYTVYYWLHPGQAMAQHQEVGRDDQA